MRVLITSVGSRGDVQPYVALGLGLARRGHDVVVQTHAPFEAFVRGHGLAFRPIAGDPQALIGGENGIAWLESAGDPIAFLRQYKNLMEPIVDPIMADLHAAVADADAVVYAPLTFPAFDFAEARGIPAMLATPVPLSATSEFPFVVWPERPVLPGPLNWLTHQAVLHAASLALAAPLNRWRQRVGLPPLLLGGMGFERQRRMHALYGFSEHVLPRPADWHAGLHVTGHWFLDPPADWRPPEALAAFLEGEPPVYVGFGSMIGRDPVKLATTVFEALRLAGRRGVVLSGWAGLARAAAPEHVLVVDDVPHAWLFPRMAAVVHHGGAGTTAAGLRAGVPAVVTPYFADQPFWAGRVHALGAGPPPVPQRSLAAGSLAAAIQAAVEDPSIRARAAALGERLRAEDGVAIACDAFERHASVAGGAVQSRREGGLR